MKIFFILIQTEIIAVGEMFIRFSIIVGLGAEERKGHGHTQDLDSIIGIHSPLSRSYFHWLTEENR